jgi:hypothetical protein
MLTRTDAALAKQRERTKRKRARRKAQARCYSIELSDRVVENLLNALVADQRLTEAAIQDKRQIERALAWLLIELERYWVT